MDKSTKINNSIGCNNSTGWKNFKKSIIVEDGIITSTVWKSKKWYTTNSKNKKNARDVITVCMDLNKGSLLQSRVTVKNN